MDVGNSFHATFRKNEMLDEIDSSETKFIQTVPLISPEDCFCFRSKTSFNIILNDVFLHFSFFVNFKTSHFNQLQPTFTKFTMLNEMLDSFAPAFPAVGGTLILIL